MNFLIISEASSMHTYNYIKYILNDNKNIKITLFDITCKKIPKEYEAYYVEREVNLVHYMDASNKIAFNDNPFFRFVKFVRKLRCLRKLGRFDVCQLEYINVSGCLLMLMNINKYTFKLLTYWGSDILQISPRLKRVQYPLLKKADAITLCTSKMFRKFHETYGDEFDDKLHKVNIIVGNLSLIERLYYSYGTRQSKAYFGIPEDKITIMCGYNGSSAQRQDVIVDMITCMDECYKKRMFIVMPFMYGCVDSIYIQRVKDKLAISGIEYTIIDRYLSYEEMAKLSLGIDIYLQLRPTDALSASMQEQIYSGSIIIQGSWLEYDELENVGLPIIKINKMEELPECLAGTIENYSNIKHDPLPEYIKQMSSGDASRKQSMEIYGHLI